MASAFTLYGIPVSPGIAIGLAHFFVPTTLLNVKRYLIAHNKIDVEIKRFKDAINIVHQEFQKLQCQLLQTPSSELQVFVDVHISILLDPVLVEGSLEIIRCHNYNAEWALITQIHNLSRQFNGIQNSYLRERKSDIQQVGDRILRALIYKDSVRNILLKSLKETTNLNQNTIIVAYDMSPTDILQFKNSNLAGCIIDLGSQNSHAAIVARTLSIPTVVGIRHACELINQHDTLAIDGTTGIIVVNPAPCLLNQFNVQKMNILCEQKQIGILKRTPAVTLDGTYITLLANIELPADGDAALEVGASGVGLFRSEFLFAASADNLEIFPSEDEQFESYRQIVVAMKGLPVTIRTFDIGADKPFHKNERAVLNPALGLRAIRYCLNKPQKFLAQLRAILRASAFGSVKLLVPMLAHAFEVEQLLAFIKQAKEQLRKKNYKFNECIKVGAMIEIPAAALALPIFTKRLDFLSIGTNDLIQYALAIDRVDPEVAHLYNPLHPGVLCLISTIIQVGRQANIPVTVCGEMAGDKKWTRLFLGMGLLEFSMHPARLLKIKQEILGSNLSLLGPQVKRILHATEPSDILKAMKRLQTI